MDRSIYSNEYIHRDFADVCRLLGETPARALETAAAAAHRRTGEIVSELHADLAGLELARAIAVEILGFEREDEVARLSVRWRPADGHGLYPIMDADLEVYPLAHGSRPLTQLSFIGHYRPPLGILGRAGDALMGRRVAEMVVKHFVEEVAGQIEAALPVVARAAG